MGFDVVDRCKTRDKEIKVGTMGVFYTEVVDNKTESDVSGGVAKKTRSRRFNKTERQEKFYQLQVRKLSGLLETVEGLVGAKEDVRLALSVGLNEGVEAKARQDFGRISRNIYFDELGVRGRST